MRVGVQTDVGTSERYFPNNTSASLFRRLDRKTFEPGKFHPTLVELNAHIIALILFAHFSECRPLLNQLNAGPNSLVRSFPCKNLRVGSREVMKPQDVQYEHLYIDFNLGPKLIRVSTRTTYKQT